MEGLGISQSAFHGAEPADCVFVGRITIPIIGGTREGDRQRRVLPKLGGALRTDPRRAELKVNAKLAGLKTKEY